MKYLQNVELIFIIVFQYNHILQIKGYMYHSSWIINYLNLWYLQFLHKEFLSSYKNEGYLNIFIFNKRSKVKTEKHLKRKYIPTCLIWISENILIKLSK